MAEALRFSPVTAIDHHRNGLPTFFRSLSRLSSHPLGRSPGLTSMARATRAHLRYHILHNLTPTPLFLWIEHITTLSTRFFHSSYHHDEGGLSLTDSHTLNLLNLKQNPGPNLPKWFGRSENTGTAIPTNSSIPNSSMFPDFVCTQTKKANK